MKVETYSTYEAKARFSEILRKVRNGETVLVSYRGKEVAEIRPVREKELTTEEKLKRLEERGVIVRGRGSVKDLKPIANRPGAVQRFLDSRD